MSQEYRILILEDDAALLELLQEVLSDVGYSVIAVSNGSDAVEAAAKHPLDLVVLDIRMPGIDGLEALALMHQHLNGAASLVITGYASEDDSIRALRLGVCDYLKKPFELSLFLDRVKQLLKRTQLRRLQEEREQRLSRLTPWLISRFVLCHPADSPYPAIATAAATARQLAHCSGFTSPQLEEIEAGTAILATKLLVSRDCSISATSSDSAQNSPTLSGSVSLAEEILAEQPGLALSIAGLACHAAPTTDSPQDRLLARSLQQLPTPAPEPQSSENHSMLALGQILLQAGQLEQAVLALSRVDRNGPPQTALPACLALATAYRLLKQNEHLPALVEQALSLASGLGPAKAGETCLQAGLILLNAGHPRARSVLEQGEAILRSLWLEPALARTILALEHFRPTAPSDLEYALHTLSQSRYEPELIRDSLWLVPELLQQATHEAAPARLRFRFLVHLAQTQPSFLLPAIGLDSLGRAEKRLLAQVLLEAKVCLAPEQLQLLRQDPDESIRSLVSRLSRQPGRESLPVLCLKAMGSLQASVNSQAIPDKAWRTSRNQFLFVYLLCAAKPVAEEQILEEFWPNLETARNNLYCATSNLRKLLRTLYPTLAESIIRVRDTISLNPDLPLWADILEIRKAWAVSGYPKRILALRRLVELAAEPFLPGCYMEWAQQERSYNLRLLAQSLLELSLYDYQQQNYAQALDYAQRLHRQEPLELKANELILRCYLKLHRFSSCQEHLRRCSRLFASELNLPLPAELAAIYNEVRLELP